jgi:2-methylcitrate dehydratase PrpD
MEGDIQEPTAALAAFAAGLSYDGIPAHVRRHIKNILLDTVACAFAGHTSDESKQIKALAEALGSSADNSVIGGGRLTPPGAALLNGYLITAVTMCDIHRPTHTHVTPEVVPPALIIAERDGKSGRDLLVALAAGLEVTTRVGLGSDYPVFRKRGWHGPGVFGAFGAAASAGRLLNLNSETMARAFGIAGSQASGTFAAWQTPVIKFHQSRGALSGLMAAILASQDFSATTEFLTAKDGGLYSTYAGGGKPQLATEDLGGRWELEQIGLRLWPSGSPMQGINTALFDIIERNDFDTDAIRAVRVRLSPSVYDMHGKLPHYKGKFEALISAHYTAAAILRDRELTMRQYEPERFDDPALRKQAEQISFAGDTNLQGVQATAEVELKDGKTLSARCDYPRGSFENPLSDDQIKAKFRTFATPFKSEKQIEEAIAMISQIEDLKSVRDLMTLLQA